MGKFYNKLSAQKTNEHQQILLKVTTTLKINPEGTLGPIWLEGVPFFLLCRLHLISIKKFVQIVIFKNDWITGIKNCKQVLCSRQLNWFRYAQTFLCALQKTSKNSVLKIWQDLNTIFKPFWLLRYTEFWLYFCGFGTGRSWRLVVWCWLEIDLDWCRKC